MTRRVPTQAAQRVDEGGQSERGQLAVAAVQRESCHPGSMRPAGLCNSLEFSPVA